ncbi:protease modulator HflC [Marivita geojedonensis]|uniref:protease modulator HflC n=1 Tax=Marivita geojedonensis TaxID=1123756 RepID=UPI000A1F52C4|nr:protease modulator HflC [Marivita geojedonensis]PRY78598.1 protease FtsH subunit HflC [Marivita geojedonensis]
MRKTTYLLPILVLAVAGLLSSLFIVDEREKALVLQFGRVVSVKEDPGLAFKIPLIQEVVRYDDRILSRDIDPLEITPLDDRRLVVDAFARYRIADVERFRQAVGVGGIPAAESRLDSILRAETREILGSVSSNDILSTDRAALMLRIRNGAIEEARALGIEIIDVRLKRTDLPAENLDATFDRMRAEREREATDERARGNEAAQRVRAQADRTVVELVSDANRQAEIIRGEADARRNNIFASAFSRDAEFFEFYRSLTAYQRALQGENSTFVMAPDSEFFNYLKSAEGLGGGISPEAAARIAGPAASSTSGTSEGATESSGDTSGDSGTGAGN